MPGDLTLRRDRRAPAPATLRPRAWTRARAITGTLVLVAVSLFALVTVVIPLILGAQTYTVLTGSMQPGMPPGTLIAVRPVAIDQVRVGDVITYQIRSGDPAVVTHRVVGTTSSTGGERLLITRGDANDRDDPPVQSEQLRGSVILALPYLGYPGAVFGGQERGAVIAAAGVAVVGYGLALLAFDAIRARRRKTAAHAAGALVAALVLAPMLMPAPASAMERADATAPDRLLVSVDGVRFVADGSVTPFDGIDDLVPGQTVSATLWVRNASADAARAALRVSAAPVSAAATDTAVAAALQLVVASSPVPAGQEWVSEVIPAGQTLRLEVGLRMDAAAGNTSRAGAAIILPAISLTQAVADPAPPSSAAPAPASPDATRPSGTLPATGADVPLVALIGAAVVALSLGLLTRRPRARRR
ncbi:signal peptidase I [uncultured Microbacterium sp.]|uniref:signal peptidase I n=1 Tax=uncultured Microbacterium sp. TaxID=191216 RepID=UPI0025D7A0DF|nr:signal peptidase I [uncultured Microbacterium sp.]